MHIFFGYTFLITLHLYHKTNTMARFQENDLPKSKITANSLQKAILIFKYADNHKWKFYLGLVLAHVKNMGRSLKFEKKKTNGFFNIFFLFT